MLIPDAQSETQPPTLLRSSRFGLRLWLALLPLALSLAANAAAENWPCGRGPRLDGTSQESGVPTHWNATNNVRWQTELPGAGHASPIVWDDRVFTVSARPEAQDRLLLCLDRRTGKPVW